MLNLWKKLTGWVLLIGLPHQNTTFNIVEHMNQRGILSHVQNVFFVIFIPPLQSNTLTMNTDEGLSQFKFLYASPRHKTIWMLNTWNKFRSWASFEIDSPLTSPWSWHVESGHCYKLAHLSPTKHYVRSTLKLTWHLESWFKCHFLPLQQNNTLNKLRQFILSHFWKLRPPDRPYTAVR